MPFLRYFNGSMSCNMLKFSVHCCPAEINQKLQFFSCGHIASTPCWWHDLSLFEIGGIPVLDYDTRNKRTCCFLCLFVTSSSWQGTLHNDKTSNATYCVYSSDVATGYGVGSFLFLLSSESLVMGVTKCMCFGRPLLPGGNRAWTIIYFVSSWWELWCSMGIRRPGV